MFAVTRQSLLKSTDPKLFFARISKKRLIPAGIYLVKVINGNTRTRCEICSKLTIKTPERRQWRLSGVFIVNFELISHLVLVFLLLTLNMELPARIFVYEKVRDLHLLCHLM